MPRISIVVPIYEVEAFLAECLDSLLAQTYGDFEVVMVDDGSPDGSAAIAKAYAAGDPRFRLVTRPNGGLGAARNTGVREAGGELLLFADSDDRLPPDALERLVGALDRTGSDFATGNIRRFDATRTWPTAFLRKAFLRSRDRTHVTRLRWLLSDRMAQNKLWRRSFWDAHALSFPEGVLHEDIPVTIPAHFLARSVDVIAEPVYDYRVREGSITAGRIKLRTLRDRFAAVEQARAFLVARGPAGSPRWYDEAVVAEDLLYHLDALPEGDDAYRAEFLDLATAYLARAGDGVEAPLPPIQRLKWHLVRRRRLPELLDVLRFEREELRRNPKRWVRGRAYGDYPFLGDPDIPLRVYRLDTTRRRARHAITLLRAQARGPRP